MAMNVYRFTITIDGNGNTPEEAWEEGLDYFLQDPGDYQSYKLIGQLPELPGED